MTGEPTRRDPIADDGRRYVLASSLEELLDLVLGDMLRESPFERVVAVAGMSGHFIARGVGVPRPEIDRFVHALERSESRSSIDVGPPHGPIDSPVDELGSFGSPILIPAVTPEDRFLAAVAVDAHPEHPALSAVREVLQSIAPFLFKGAEFHAMRSKVASLESYRLRFRMALDALPDPVMVMDSDARILLSNRRTEELLVTGPDDNTGRRHAVETNNLYFSAFRAKALLDGDQGTPTRELLLVDPTDGSDLLFEVFVEPFHLAESAPESSIFVLRDITDLKQATHELEVQFSRSVAARHEASRESERLNVIIENAGVPILVTDRQTNIVLMNKEAERLFESPGEGESTPVRDIRMNDTRLSGFINEFLLQQVSRREGRLTLVDPDERAEFPALVVSTKVLGKHDEAMGAVTVLRDLTQEVENQHLAQELKTLNTRLEERVRDATSELAQRNRQLEEQRTELQRTSRMKSEFLATMSHELRTPINAVLGYNSLLQEGLFGELSDSQEDALRRMRKAAEHLLTLINDILDLSRVEAGKIQVDASEIDLPEFLDELSESVRPMATQKSLDYSLAVDPETSDITTDPTRLRQVLLNLLSNAVKFTDEGAITLRCDSSADGDVCFEVSDTGIGIEEEYLETIFEEFTQADQSETRQHGGVGLGLAISRKLILIMGGTLDVQSEVDVGTTFRLVLPRVYSGVPDDVGLKELRIAAPPAG